MYHRPHLYGGAMAPFPGTFGEYVGQYADGDVYKRQELAKAMDEMIATDGPCLLEACVEEEGNVMPMTPPGGSVNQMLLDVYKRQL